MKEEVEYPNLDTICRLCLKENAAAVHIFGEDGQTGKVLSVPMRIMACAALEVQTGDGLPKHICGDCRYQLEKSFYFRKKAQLSDNKLRKHIRLLSAGKISRVFLKDEDDDEELEFEDSLKFIKDQDDVRHAEESEVREKERLVWQQELEELKKSQAKNLKKQILERTGQIKRELYEEIKKKVTLDLETDLREKLSEECISKAKAELREECRTNEMKQLLEELDMFLHQKKSELTKLADEQVKEPSIKKAEEVNIENPVKRTNTTEMRVTRFRKRVRTSSNEDVTSSKSQENVSDHEEFEVIPKSMDYNADLDTTNFFIVDTESNNSEKEFIEEIAEGYEEEGEEQYPLDNSATETELYEIEANGEIQTLNKNDGKMLLYNMSVGEEDQVEMVEFVDMKIHKKNKENANEINSFTNAKTKDVTTVAGFTKMSPKKLDGKDSVEGEEEKKLPYTRPTDTPKTFKCDLCHMTFSTANTLNRHIRTHARSEKNGVSFECPECHVIFSCRSALKRHAIIHTGKRPYKCDECGKSFVQREILKRHQQVHTGERPYQCPHCPRDYTQKVNLQQHINYNHSKVPKLNQYSCHLCTKRFNHASGLSRHLTTHSGITYQCMECERCFADRSSVKRHVLHVHMSSTENNENANKFIKECVKEDK